MKKPVNLILIAVAIGVFYTFTSPQWGEVQGLKASAAEYGNALENIESIIENRDKLLEKYNALPKTEIDRLAKVLPNEAGAVGLAVDLDGMASRYGIVLKDLDVGGESDRDARTIALPENAKAYEKVVVNFSFISNYPNFISFLADLEKSLRIMDVTSVSFNTSPTGVYDHKLTVETYWLR